MTDVTTDRASSSLSLPLIFGTAGLLFGLAVGALMLAFAHFGVAGVRSMLLPSPMQTALVACGKFAHPSFVLERDGTVLFAAFYARGDGRGHGHETRFEDVHCVLKELGAPDEIDDRISDTRPSDGIQTMQWDGYSADWGFAGHAGVILTITER